ncbi:hypothetical protein TNCV_3072211 [Trichonephila clavipes]|nr:hypothetical protein TNCV_3072211 [Trichonephila clavipes]
MDLKILNISQVTITTPKLNHQRHAKNGLRITLTISSNRGQRFTSLSPDATKNPPCRWAETRYKPIMVQVLMLMWFGSKESGLPAQVSSASFGP